ncbi:esterase-like activity of phytase family protein [Rhizobium sp. BK251]|uniref:esterase-like activity of phytase family protein n=1 Tax=Rhizobium sp. BK251 TaxID=2512125 RepID=UPI0010492E84|nr:esterase-like activity of phytase family protein [Rhizobium sp. BK251]TCL72689.1 hypothetical protein EV286_104112 [Rhizobium sp. BK251]
MRLKRLSQSVALSISLVSAIPAAFAGESAPVDSRAITEFRIGRPEKVFGRLEFLGGLELYSRNRLFGALSAIRFREDGRHFVGVLDTGHWLTGRVVRDAEGRLSGVEDVVITPMKDRTGRTYEGKGRMDAESMALHGDSILVGFEQRHRIEAYPDPGFEDSPSTRSVPILIPPNSLRGNRGLEALAVAPQNGPLKGGTVAVSEKSLDRQGNLLAAILDGPLQGRFSVRPDGEFDVTDGAFLPSGDLLLLERRFNMASGIGMRLRLIKGGDIKPGAVVDGEVLIDTDFGYQIDNMEGLDVFQAADGSTHLVMVSDDNHSILQRTVMLEFQLEQEPLTR